MKDVGNVQTQIDVAVGAGGITVPAWFPYLYAISEVAAAVAVIGGAILVLLRIALAWREWRAGK